MKKTAFFMIATLLFSVQIMAHPGHDHHSSASLAVHLLFTLSIIGAMVAASFFVIQKKKKLPNKH